ncbi:MAG: hypothetical protein OXG55_02725 [bacterium]|nr:hypothetical protein [bacterium]MCY4102171.1 hypothetical protein [bacterium]
MTSGTAPAEAPSRQVAERRFSQSMIVSGTRCLLAYVVFPYVFPLLGVADVVGPAVGVAIGVVAIVFNALSIRRFWRGNHRLKWPLSVVNLAVMGLMFYLAVGDVAELAG